MKHATRQCEYRPGRQAAINHKRATRDQPKVVAPKGGIGNYKQYGDFFEPKKDRG